jgi:membrane-associated protease RseP (regulator of RpoE activity)
MPPTTRLPNPRFTAALLSLLLLLAVSAVPVAADSGDPQVRAKRAAGAGDAKDEKDVRKEVRVERMRIPHGELISGPRGYLGVGLLVLTPELRTHFGATDDAGALVASVAAGSPAEKAGIKVGDVLTRIDGQPVDGPHDVRAQIRDAEEGESAAIEIVRDGRPQTVTATLERRERSELDVSPLFIRDGGPGDHMVLRIDPDKMGEHLEELELPLGDHPRVINLRRREAELEKRLAELEKRLAELEKQLQR